jgi:hypothetical protein
MEPRSVLFVDDTSHGFTFLSVHTLQELEEAGRQDCRHAVACLVPSSCVLMTSVRRCSRQRFAQCDVLPPVFFGERTRVPPKRLLADRVLKQAGRLVVHQDNSAESPVDAERLGPIRRAHIYSPDLLFGRKVGSFWAILTTRTLAWTVRVRPPPKCAVQLLWSTGLIRLKPSYCTLSKKGTNWPSSSTTFVYR